MQTDLCVVALGEDGSTGVPGMRAMRYRWSQTACGQWEGSDLGGKELDHTKPRSKVAPCAVCLQPITGK